MAAPTPFVINMVPAGFKWSADAARKADAKGQFLRVGGATVTRRALSGAKRSWRSDDPEVNQTIFNTEYRITGTPKNVAFALQYAGIGNDQIQRALNTSITNDNYQTTAKGAYDAEIIRRAGLQGAKPAAEGYEWNQILWFAQNLDHAVVQTKAGEQRGALASPGRAGRAGGHGESLAEKIRKLAPGAVIDVSGMDANGKGIRSNPHAPKTAKSGKFGNGRVPIISNNIDKYIRAIELAYGPQGPATYATEIDNVRRALALAPAAAAGVAAAPLRVATPPRVAGATLAPQPVFVPAVTTPRAGVRTVGGANFPAIPGLQGLVR